MKPVFSEENISLLIDEMHRLFPLPGRQVFRVLKKLEKEALARGDHDLLGFVYYYFANAYLSRNDQAHAHKYLRQAVNHLMRSGEDELLARTFNLFALDAQYAGCYDVAQNYFQMAYSLVQNNENSLVRAILDANLGNLLAEIGDYASARRHIRRAIPVVRYHSDDVLSDQNLAVAYLNTGLYSLHQKKQKEAETSLRRSEKILAQAEIEETIYLTLLLLRAHVAFAAGDRKKTLPQVDALAARIRNQPLYNDFVCDLVGFCHCLLREGGSEYASILIDAIQHSDHAGVSWHHRLLLTELAIDHYTRENNEAKLQDSFALQHEISLRQWDAQKQMYLYSVEMMLLITDLREEQFRVRRENDLLRQQVETDPLTGIPNRHAMNRELESALDRMLRTNRSLGISIIDIDAFKRYNDLYGHAQGDQCLRLVAGALQRVADAHHLFVARYGGDEFVLISEDRTDAELAAIAAEIDTQMPVRVSLGSVNVVPDHQTRLFDLLSRADDAMYQEKRGHR